MRPLPSDLRDAAGEIDLDLVEACERRIVNAWPSISSLVLDDWIVRFANGYSGRANSASALNRGARLEAGLLDAVETLYREAGLPPCLRLTPLAAQGARELLLARGYLVKDASHGMVAPLPQASAPGPETVVSPVPTPDWIAAVAERQTGAKRHAGNLAEIVTRVRLPAAFVTVTEAGRPVALAMSVAERGLAEIGSVVVDEAFRGRGLGRRLMGTLFHWAASQGCDRAYLQVDRTNEVAIGLYAALGFRTAYSYETWWRG